MPQNTKTTSRSETGVLLTDYDSLPHTVTEEVSFAHKFTEQLGPVTAEFKHAEIGQPLKQGITAGTVLGILLLLISGFLYFYGLITYGYAVAVAWSKWIFAVSVSIFIVVFILVITRKINQKAVYIHRDGIALHKWGRKPLFILWRQLAGISFFRQDFSLLFIEKTVSSAVLYPNKGGPVNLSRYYPIEKISDLVTLIKARLYPKLEPELLKMYKNGQMLYFGSLVISTTGIKIGERIIEWGKVDQIFVSEGYLHFSVAPEESEGSKETERIRMSLQNIYNLELFLIVVRKAVQPALLK